MSALDSNFVICNREKLENLYKRANAGDAESQFLLGMHFLDAEFEDSYDESIATGIREQDAVYWLTKAAEQGNVDAQFVVGNIYRDGFGVEKNNSLAIAWYKKAAAHGHGAAMWWIADIFDEAAQRARKNPFKRLWAIFRGDENATAAIEWYNRVITAGNSDKRRNDARCRLGEIYRKGEIVKRDYDLAIKYYRAVDGFGCDVAREKIAEIEKLQNGKKTR